jgi:anti-sigma factor RsiW
VSPANDGGEHVPDLSLDLAVQGELSEADTRVMHRPLDACRDCRERYEAATGDAAHFRKHILPRTLEHVARGLDESRARTSTRRSPRLIASVLASAAVAAAMVVILVHREPAGTDASPHGLLRKGAPELAVFARHGERVFRVTDHAHLDAGDALRFHVEPAGAPYLMVASIDGANRASVYVPYDGKASLRVPEDRTFRDDGAIALDATPGPERIFALFSRHPLDAGDVTRALSRIGARGYAAIRAGDRLNIPDAFEVSLCIEK